MREIKFRGKTKDDGEWVYGGYFTDKGEHYIPLGIGRAFVQVVPETVGQFTGLLDKNGKEIYEGDILKTNQALVIHEVVFYQSSFTTIRRANEHGRELRQKVGEKFYGQDTYLDEPLDDLVGGSEIIGNIHDNPELLKGETK